MDRVIKTYFDEFRKRGEMPPELQVKAFENIKLYPDQKRLDLWRNWRTGPVWTDADGSQLGGALDDLMMADGLHIPFDYKTKGSPTKPEDAVRYYQNQIDCYALLVHENKHPVTDYGYLLYFSPKQVGERGSVQFHLQAIKMQTDIERARNTFRDAVRLIKGNKPARNAACEYCDWLKRAQGIEELKNN